MILTEIGEVGIVAGERHYKLRPSLYAMTRLGSPEEIVRVYASVMADDAHKDQFADALAVVYACCTEDLTDIYGWHEADGKTVRYVPGTAPVGHIIPLAKCLLKHGITGALPALPVKNGAEPEYLKGFDARANVSLAIAHLGMGSEQAWQMTMTELVGALRAKFPQPDSNAPGAKAPSAEQLEATMEWFERVQARRNHSSSIS